MRAKEMFRCSIMFIAGLLAFAGGAQAATAFDWRTDCVGRFSLELPGKVEVAMVVNKAFEKPDYDPMYPTEAAIGFMHGGGGYHFADGEETSRYTGSTTSGSNQSMDTGASISRLATGPQADAAEFARFSRAMDSHFRHEKERLGRSRDPEEVERATSIEPITTALPNTHAWRWGASAYYLFWRDQRLFSLSFREDRPESTPNPQYVSEHIRSREIFEVPKEQGLCLHQAFLPDDGTLPRQIAMTYRLKDHPEIEIYFSDNFNRHKEWTTERVIGNFWERRGAGVYAKKLQLISRHFPGIVHFPDVEIAGYTGKRSFVEITNKDDTLDYGYFALVRGDPNAKEDRPELMLYVVSTNANATGVPLSKQQIEEIADHIAASIKRR